MKPSNTLTPTALAKPQASQLRTVVMDALSSVDDARQKCMAAGQFLNELKEAHKHGDFMELVARTVPEISERTARDWMRAAANVLKALPMGAIDIEASVILNTPDAELTEEQLEWKQGWFDFTNGKTIKECLNGVIVDGDEPHRIDRAINGKTKGGSGGDRKDFPLFSAVKLKDLGVHLSHWKNMSEAQRTEVKTTLMSAIAGESVTIRKRTFNFEIWPEELCEVAREAITARLKGRR